MIASEQCDCSYTAWRNVSYPFFASPSPCDFPPPLRRNLRAIAQTAFNRAICAYRALRYKTSPCERVCNLVSARVGKETAHEVKKCTAGNPDTIMCTMAQALNNVIRVFGTPKPYCFPLSRPLVSIAIKSICRRVPPPPRNNLVKPRSAPPIPLPELPDISPFLKSPCAKMCWHPVQARAILTSAILT